MHYGITIRRRVRLVMATVAVALGTAGPAEAFYWRGWPGSGIIVAPLIVDPNDRTPGNPPSDPLPVPGTENVYVPPVGPPEPVPEPATGLAGLIGLGTALAVRRFRRRVDLKSSAGERRRENS